VSGVRTFFATTKTSQGRPLFQSERNATLMIDVLRSYVAAGKFRLHDFVIMPNHVHLLLTEPEHGDPSEVMKALKQGFARRLLARLRLAPNHLDHLSLGQPLSEPGRIWQARFYDFVVYSEKKRIEKLRYIHGNPVKRGLVVEPQDWAWSSFRHYAYDEPGPVVVNEVRRAELRMRKVS